MQKTALLMVVAVAVGCRGEDPEDYPVVDDREPYGELATAADTAEDEFGTDEPVGVIAVQGGALLEGPFTATGNLRGAGAAPSRGAVTITEADGGTRVLISLEGHQPGGELQATFVLGRCGEDGTVVQVVEPLITMPGTGVANFEATVPVPTRTLFDGAHSLKIVPAPAEPGPQSAGAVIACADLTEV